MMGKTLVLSKNLPTFHRDFKNKLDKFQYVVGIYTILCYLPGTTLLLHDGWDARVDAGYMLETAKSRGFNIIEQRGNLNDTLARVASPV